MLPNSVSYCRAKPFKVSATAPRPRENGRFRLWSVGPARVVWHAPLSVRAATRHCPTFAGSAFLFGLATSRGWACTWTLFASNALILAAMLLLATGSAVGLYLGVVLSGAVYGGYWTLLPLCMAELYGVLDLGLISAVLPSGSCARWPNGMPGRALPSALAVLPGSSVRHLRCCRHCGHILSAGLANLGANYKIMTVAEAIGYLVVGRLLAARVYEDHIAEGDGNTCLGPDCFRETLMIAAGLLLSGALASIWLSLRVARKHEK